MVHGANNDLLLLFGVSGASTSCNVALRKVTYQVSESTQYSRTYYSQLAVDGNNIANIEAGGCAMTGMDINPWWAVDLGKRMTVQSVTLISRKQLRFIRLTKRGEAVEKRIQIHTIAR